MAGMAETTAHTAAARSTMPASIMERTRSGGSPISAGLMNTQPTSNGAGRPAYSRSRAAPRDSARVTVADPGMAQLDTAADLDTAVARDMADLDTAPAPVMAAARDMAPAPVTGRLAIATDLGRAPSSRKARRGPSPVQTRNLDRRRARRGVEDAVSLRLADAIFRVVAQQNRGGAAVDINDIGQRLRAADHVRPVK